MARGEEKQHRMEARRASGSRAWGPSPWSVTLRSNRRIAHACFQCRKSFKITPEDAPERRCPQCREPLREMGFSFKAPRIDDVAAWKLVQSLYAHGYRFFTTGREGSPVLPRKLSELADFLQRHPQHPLKVADPQPDLLP